MAAQAKKTSSKESSSSSIFDEKFLLIKKLYDAGKISFEEVAALTEISRTELKKILAPSKRSKKILVTGGAGFIGSNFVHYLLERYPDYQIVNLDKLTYAGNLENLKPIENDPRYIFIKGDISNADDMERAFTKHTFDFVVNFAAETHVERSIHAARDFVFANVVGVQTLLDMVNKYNIKRMVHVSTDESYGSLELDDASFTEESPLRPNVPYSATKAGGDLLCRAYYHTHKTPVIVTHCTNNFGFYQYPEKLIPLFTLRAVQKKSLTLHGKGQHVRDWLFVKDHCRAIDMILHNGKEGETYNIGSGMELPTVDIAGKILKLLGRPRSLMTFIPDRPGNDLRYSLTTKKIEKELGWKPEFSFDNYLAHTIQWYLNNPGWINGVRARMDGFGKGLNI